MSINTVIKNERFTVEQAVAGPLDNNIFVISTESSDEQAALIDAAVGNEQIVQWAMQRNVNKVLTTHNHHDHIGGIPAMQRQRIAVGIGTQDSHPVSNIDFLINDGDEFAVGDVTLRAITTPGHTSGSTCFELVGEGVLFTGDTLFPGGPGATKTREAFATIMQSLDTLFARFGDDVLILPGHGASTTFGEQRPLVEQWRKRGW